VRCHTRSAQTLPAARSLGFFFPWGWARRGQTGLIRPAPGCPAPAPLPEPLPVLTAGLPPPGGLIDGPLGKRVPPGRAKSDGAPSDLCLYLKITLHPKNWRPRPPPCVDVWESSPLSRLLLGLSLFPPPRGSPSFLEGQSTSVAKAPFALYINFYPLSRARSPAAASWSAGGIPTSVCPLRARAACYLRPHPFPPVSTQTKVGDAFFPLSRAVGEQLSWNKNSLIKNKCWRLQGGRKKAAQGAQSGKRPSSYLTTAPVPPGSHLRLKPECQ